MIAFDLSLYLVTDSTLSLNRPLEQVVEEAVKGGVTMVQLREKNSSTLNFYNKAIKLKQILKPHNIPLIINDRLDIALACGAEGLHIGQSDMPYNIARKLFGKNKIIGLSVESIDDVVKANMLDVDYIGISPVFSTPTKTDTAKALGLEGVKEISKITKHPTVAIGGINPTNAKEIIMAGANGISVVSAIISSQNPKESALELKRIISEK